MYDRSFGRNDQKSSDLFKKIKFEIRDSICNLWDRIWKNARMLALFLYIFIKTCLGNSILLLAMYKNRGRYWDLD